VATKQYTFLSDDWMAAARRIRDKHLPEAKGMMSGLPDAASVRMNQIITDVPFGEGVIDAHIDSTSGSLSLDVGHIENPDVTVTVDYATAKALFVDQDMGIAMQAFMSGKIRVDGDLTKLLALQAAGTQALPDGAENKAQLVAEELKGITAE
jgi:putative sterol carrier protein